jgi:hypothetical protein
VLQPPALLAAASLLGLLGCVAPPRGRTLESPTAHALPEPDPALRGTPQGSRTLEGTEVVAVRLGRDASGNVTLLEVVSPALTPEQQREVARAFAAGEWKRAAPLSPVADSWVENLVRARP